MALYEKRLEDLEGRVQAFTDADHDEEMEDDDRDPDTKIPLQIMRDLCILGRNVEQDSAAEKKDAILDRVEGLLYQTLAFCHETELFEHTESFAHDSTIKHRYPGDNADENENENVDPSEDDNGSSSCDYPLVRDMKPKGVFSRQITDIFASLMTFMGGQFPGNPSRMPKPPAPWWEISRPHPRSSGLSRFRDNVPVLSATDATPVALNVYQARCEVGAENINTPIRIVSHSSPTECILAIPCMGGYKDRTPFLQYLIDAEPLGGDNDHTVEHYVTVGLSDIAYHSAIDPSRKLLFTGDGDRVKSYEWGELGRYHEEAKAVHTFASGGFDGPMLVLGDGRFMRAGRGKIGVWNLNSLTEETHAKYGKRSIGGRRISIEDTWRDDPEEIERSPGTPVGQTIDLWLPKLKPEVIKPHPAGTANLVLLSAEYNRDNAGDVDPRAQYSCVILDIEQGKPVSKILGHGDDVKEFSTSSADPNVFVTGCGDGYVRLFDVRTHFPVITFDAAYREEECGAVALAHPDGIPSLFTGLQQGQHIKFWDIRAKAVVYDLGTGNNAVGSLAWDGRRQVLYAATACEHITRFGDRMDYRKLQIPRPPKPGRDNRTPGNDGTDEMDDEDDDEDDEDDDEGDDEYGSYMGRGWPKKAYHAEDYYPHIYDAASHRLFRYAFKTEPNPDDLPQGDMW